MTPCTHAQHLLESDLGPSEHCEACRELSEALRERQADLDRALETFANGGDRAAAIRRAMAEAPPVPQGRQHWDRWFHGSLIAVAAALVLAVLWMARPVAPSYDLAAELEALEAVQDIAWDALPEDEWAERARELWALAEGLESEADPLHPDVLPVLHGLYYQAGRAAQSSNRVEKPFYDTVGGQTVVVPWHRAASLELFAPDLAGDPNLGFYGDKIGAGELPARYGVPEDMDLPEYVPPPADAPITPGEAALMVEEVAGIPWNALTAEQWAEWAERLFEAGESLESGMDPEQSRTSILLFNLWLEAGRAAENANDPKPPYYDKVDGTTVNIAWYRAASVAHHSGRTLEPDFGKLSSVLFYLNKIEAGDLPARTVER